MDASSACTVGIPEDEADVATRLVTRLRIVGQPIADALHAAAQLAGVLRADDGEGADSLFGELAALADSLDPPLSVEASRRRRMEAAVSPAYVADANRTRLPSQENP